MSQLGSWDLLWWQIHCVEGWGGTRYAGYMHESEVPGQGAADGEFVQTGLAGLAGCIAHGPSLASLVELGDEGARWAAHFSLLGCAIRRIGKYRRRLRPLVLLLDGPFQRNRAHPSRASPRISAFFRGFDPSHNRPGKGLVACRRVLCDYTRWLDHCLLYFKPLIIFFEAFQFVEEPAKRRCSPLAGQVSAIVCGYQLLISRITGQARQAR